MWCVSWPAGGPKLEVSDAQATGDLLSHFEAKEVEGSPPPPSWNVAPTQDVPIIAERLG
ncbi:putative SOS response-associated peptidase YedK [Pseudarthrobacter oxydans]|jgi:hypothetical protein|nr:putative SOS response-associated peptidase YedK [Pseudarthrobacter oxydans]